MLTLFHQYKESGELSKALIVGRNLFNRHPESIEVFTAYFDFLCTLAEKLPSITDRQQFGEQARIAISFFSENAEMSEDLIGVISENQERLDAIFTALNEQHEAIAQAEQKKLEQQNQKGLLKVHDLKQELSKVADEVALNKVLNQLAKIDAELDKEGFTPDQAAYYDSETKEFTELISEVMRKLEHKKNVAYNKQAADSFAKAFEVFRKDEEKYKDKNQLRALALNSLFCFDASRLFNETLIYYNHIYSYIFSKLDDDGKFALTKFSIEGERKQG